MCAGDTVLRLVANMIGAHCREGDVSARYGGDEFMVCLVGARLEGALKVLERLRGLVADYSGRTTCRREMRVTSASASRSSSRATPSRRSCTASTPPSTARSAQAATA